MNLPIDSAHVIEHGKRLSESLLWSAQRAYFERAGIGAWSTGTVPHYVVTNPALAHAMARVVFGYLRDVGAQADGEPAHIIELGAGSGRFGYMFLKALLELRSRSPWPSLPFRYVMTDLVDRNVAFWQAHPALEPLIAQG